jgi:precorrin-6A/cobalt-precorrin-6A reductase
MRILVLGGTREASALAELVAERPAWDMTLSLAGRTSEPKPLPVSTRIGGFGGIDGLARWLGENLINAVVDATHPFAAVISRNAVEACRAAGVPLLAVRRPPWRAVAGDRWIEVATIPEAVRALGPEPRCVFLTVGRLELQHFAAAPKHRYVVRTIEPIAGALLAPNLVPIRDRGPFDAGCERELMQREGIDVIVTKNSGGDATYGKIAAARQLGLPVIMVTRPAKPEAVSVATPEAAMDWLARQSGAP